MSDSNGPLAIRFVMSQNKPVSLTRVTAATVSALARFGIPTTVVFPLVDWLDYKLLRIRLGGLREKTAWVARLFLEVAWKSVFRRPWCGFRYYHADPRIRTSRYLWAPPGPPIGAREVTIVQHPYVMPHLLQRLRDHRAVIVCVINNNYELEIQSPSPEQAAWKRHCLAIERMLSVPRVAVSQGTKQAAERLGIRVDRVIHDGMELGLFQPPASRNRQLPLTVTLSCATLAQKGQRTGVEAMRLLRARAGNSIRICSLGDVLSDYQDDFDHHYGYLHGAAYVRAIQATDIFVYPSLFDGFPAPPLEAMACGCAVVTTAVEGVTDYAVEGDNCLVCPTGDAQALAEAAFRLIEDAPLRARLQHRGPVTAREHGADETARQLLAFCEELLEGKLEHADRACSTAS